MSHQLGSVINTHDYSYRGKDKNTIAIVKDRGGISSAEADQIIESVSDLIDDKKFKPFFYKKLYQHGKGWFLEQEQKARQPYINNPSRFFVHLMR